MATNAVAVAAEDRIGIDFIDPLFAVVLHVSFAHIAAEPWFQDFRLVPSHFFEVATILMVGYTNLILSWVGYHRSIKTSPLSVKNTAGFARFILDVLLLVAYFVMLASYSNFRRQLWVLVVVYVLFVIWDQFKATEHPDGQGPEAEGRRARRGVTVVWLFVFTTLAILCAITPHLGEGCVKWLWLALTFVALIGYRYHKAHLWPRNLLLNLGYPWHHG